MSKRSMLDSKKLERPVLGQTAKGASRRIAKFQNKNMHVLKDTKGSKRAKKYLTGKRDLY